MIPTFSWSRVSSSRIISANVRPGSLYPPHATAMGKVLLAQLEPALVRELVARRPLERFTPTTVTDIELLLDQLREVARRGFAVSDAEWEPGLRSLAAPVRTRDGRVVAAVCVIVVRAEVTRRAMECDLLPALLETARAISAELGYGLNTLKCQPSLPTHSRFRALLPSIPAARWSAP